MSKRSAARSSSPRLSRNLWWKRRLAALDLTLTQRRYISSIMRRVLANQDITPVAIYRTTRRTCGDVDCDGEEICTTCEARPHILIECRPAKVPDAEGYASFVWASRSAAGRSITSMPRELGIRTWGLVKVYEFSERDR